MKKIDQHNQHNRPQTAKKLELRRETLRRLEAIELENARGGLVGSFPTVTRDDI